MIHLICAGEQMQIARERHGTYHIVDTFITKALQDPCELEDLRADSWLSRSLVSSGVDAGSVVHGVYTRFEPCLEM
jgi:hypothetical protein